MEEKDTMSVRKRRIGEILIENNFITEKVLEAALDHQKKFGGNITQYLVGNGYVKEEEVAKCISQQFNYPYLPLRAYDIPPQIIGLIPSDIAERYLLLPVDKIGNIITVVMSDPLDEEAIKAVEETTNCKVQPFVGILSDIARAIKDYYKISVEVTDIIKAPKPAPLFIPTKTYKGVERRKSVRLKANIAIHFPAQDEYRGSETKDVSRHGFLFESVNLLPMGSYVVMEIDLPEQFCPYPIAAVVQVVRVVPLENKRFDIGVKIISIAKDDIDKIIRYASTNT